MGSKQTCDACGALGAPWHNGAGAALCDNCCGDFTEAEMTEIVRSAVAGRELQRRMDAAAARAAKQEQQQQRIVTMRQDGKSLAASAAALGISKPAVAARLKTLTP